METEFITWTLTIVVLTREDTVKFALRDDVVVHRYDQ